MLNTPDRANSLNATVLQLMAAVEDQSGKMMHEIDTALELRCIEAMDAKIVPMLNEIIRELESLLETI